MYYTQNQRLPGGGFVSNFAGGCLGTAADYPATADFPAGACFKSVPRTTGVPFYYSFNPQLNTDLGSVISTFPSGATPLVRQTGGMSPNIYDYTYRGIFYYFYNYPPGNSFTDGFQIIYHTTGNMPCGPDLWSRSIDSASNSTECNMLVDFDANGVD